MWQALAATTRSRSTWLGLTFGLFGGAAFKSLEVIFGPFLIDRGYSQAEIGWFSAGPMIVLMIAGSLFGGWLADKTGRKRLVAGALIWIVIVVSALAVSDRWAGEIRGPHLLACLAGAAFGIGVFTASSYALFMDLTDPALGASQFSAFMGSTNGCESWSTYVIGQVIAAYGYAAGMLLMSLVSLAAIPLLLGMRLRQDALDAYNSAGHGASATYSE